MPKKGYRQTEEHKMKVSNALKGKTPKHFEEIQKRAWEANRGRNLSDEHKKKISKGVKNNLPKTTFKKGHSQGKRFKKGQIPWNKEKELPQFQEENSPHWKGDNVGYLGLHVWVVKKLGKPKICENCGANGLNGHSIHWANKSGEYKRELNDWLRLCVPCHSTFDKERRNSANN